MKTQKIQVYRLGLVPYAKAWQLQEKLAASIAAGEHPPALLLLEHPHTYTFGRRGNAANLLWDEAELKRRGIEVHWVDRGGDVTYHGPGQLVGYPLLPLGTPETNPQNQAHLPKADYVDYLRRLEEVLLLTLEAFKVHGERIPGMTGVWVRRAEWARPRKIAAIGVKVDVHGISRHGFALNVNPDMTYWEGIIGCGLRDYQETCLAEVLPAIPPMSRVIETVENAFSKVFAVHLTHSTTQPPGE